MRIIIWRNTVSAGITIVQIAHLRVLLDLVALVIKLRWWRDMHIWVEVILWYIWVVVGMRIVWLIVHWGMLIKMRG